MHNQIESALYIEHRGHHEMEVLLPSTGIHYIVSYYSSLEIHDGGTLYIEINPFNGNWVAILNPSNGLRSEVYSVSHLH
jgi:hypothetical protein